MIIENPVLSSIELRKGKYFLKLKYFCEVKDGTHDTPPYVDPAENTYPLVTSKDITEGIMSFEKAKHISENDYIAINKRSNVEKNDVIMPMIGTIGNPSIIETDKKFSIKNVALFKTNGDVVKAKYLKYLLSSNIVQEQIEMLNRGGVQSFVSLGVLQNLSISLCENINDVVAFLDLKTKEVDEIIVLKTKFIQLLEEKRQAIITEAVTKGLNPHVKMKDSGVEWIGEIPEHWDVIKAKYIFNEKSVKGYPEKRLLSVSKGKGVIPRDKMEFKVVMAFKDLQNFKLVQPEDFVIHLRSFQSGFEMSKIEGIVSPAYTIFSLKNEGVANYYKYVFYSNAFIDAIASTTQSLRDGKPIAYTDFGNMGIMIPTLREQNEIAQYIEANLKAIDELVDKIQLSIDKLKEYRQSLIFEAVTGKIDVRDIEIES